MRRSNEVRVDESWPHRMLPSHSNKACKCFNCKFCTIHIADPSTTKCKPVAVLQFSSTLMTGQTRTNSHQLLSKVEAVQSQWECMRVGGQTLATVATLILVWPCLNSIVHDINKFIMGAIRVTFNSYVYFFSLLGSLVQKQVSLNPRFKIHSTFPNNLFTNLEIFLQKSCVDQ